MAPQAHETPMFIAQSGPLNGQQWDFNHELILGRNADCDIIIPDRQVSRHHARISCRPDGCYLEDLGSKNGTHINGRRVEAGLYLEDGDVVQIAFAQEFMYLSPESTAPLELLSRERKSARKKLRLEKRSRRVWIGETELTPTLSVAQFTILEMLYNRAGRVVSREELADEVWGTEEAADVSPQALDALIRRLRKRLAQVDRSHNYIRTVRGHGLRLDNPGR